MGSYFIFSSILAVMEAAQNIPWVFYNFTSLFYTNHLCLFPTYESKSKPVKSL